MHVPVLGGVDAGLRVSLPPFVPLLCAQALAGAQQSAAARQQQIKDIEAATKRCRQQIEQHKSEQAAVADRSK